MALRKRCGGGSVSLATVLQRWIAGFEVQCAETERSDAAGHPAAYVDRHGLSHAQYKRMCRVIARVLRDPARAEELAVEVFLRWSRHPNAHGDKAEGWLYRTAVREALDELRRRT